MERREAYAFVPWLEAGLALTGIGGVEPPSVWVTRSRAAAYWISKGELESLGKGAAEPATKGEAEAPLRRWRR